MSLNAMGKEMSLYLAVELPNPFLPPWVQVGNGADPDERHGSFTENRQNWKRCPDAERGNFQQN